MPPGEARNGVRARGSSASLKLSFKEQRPKLGVAGGCGHGDGEQLFRGYGVSSWGGENVLELETDHGFMTLTMD